MPAKLSNLTVTADLNHGQVTATVETSDDGFKTIRSQARIPLRDGADTHPLGDLEGTPRGVRVRFDLARGKPAAATPVIDAFRITGEPAGEKSAKSDP